MTKRSAADLPPNASGLKHKRRVSCNKEEEDGRLLTILELTFNGGFFQLQDLQALLNTSKAIAGPLRTFQGWKEHFSDDKVHSCRDVTGQIVVRRTNPLGLAPPVGRISKECWTAPHLPRFSTSELNIPPRPRARTQQQPDRHSYYPARGDNPGYVLASMGHGSCTPLQRFHQETGVLEDLFYSAADDASPRPWPFGMIVHRTPHYKARPLPIVCHDCNVTCTSYAQLVEHCCSLPHQLATIPTDRRIPKEFWDPRNQPAYANKTPFQQVEACMKYKRKILDFLRAPMDAAGLRNMERHLRWITGSAQENGFSTANCTLENVTAACVEFVCGDFEHYGMNVHGYCRDVIVNGWGEFDCHGSSSSEILFTSVVGDY